jgi:pimeloyl-ACP methyl ester carboxylesterase
MGESWPRIVIKLLGVSIGLLFSSISVAETVMLVHGYLSGGDDWRRSGIVGELARAGWTDAGTLLPAQDGMRHHRGRNPASARRLYTIELPDDAPLQVQAGLLADAVYWVHRRHPNEAVSLVGHSAGGVVGRLMMVQQPQTRVAALISIASPHLGTDSADLGVLAGESPLADLAPLLGADKFTRSLGLYRDLVRERPGTFLFWLNRQNHPPARYVCAIHNGSGMDIGDLIVPAWSQDLNRVSALRGRAERHVLEGYHGLTAADGRWLVGILGNAGI